MGVAKVFWSCFALLSMATSAFASDWQTTYYDTRRGTLLIDRDSISEVKGERKTVWTLFAPRVIQGQPGEGYAYSKMLHTIDCAARMAGVLESVYFDENGNAHFAAVEDKSMHYIDPDGRDDYLWQYVCKTDRQDKLASHAGNISSFLKDQIKFTKESMQSAYRKP